MAITVIDWVRSNWEKGSEWIKEHISDCEEAVGRKVYSTSLNRAIRHVRTQKGGNYVASIDKGEGVQTEEDGNERTVYCNASKIIHTLDDLIEVSETDLSTWFVANHKLNAWPVAGKVLSKDGVAEWAVQQLYQVKAYLQRKVAENTVIPPLHNVNCVAIASSFEPPATNFTPGLAVVLSDAQATFWRDLITGRLTPAHSRKALSIALQVIHTHKPEIVILNGDFIDLPDWSDKFVRSPEMQNVTQLALWEVSWFFAQIRRLSPSSRVVFVEGNHEARLQRAVKTHLPAAYGLKRLFEFDKPELLSIEHLLSLRELNIEVTDSYPDGAVWLGNHTMVGHGDVSSSKSGASVRRVVDQSVHNVAFGHIHRIERATRTIPTSDGPKQIWAQSFGCMCRNDGTVPAKKHRNNWQEGFGAIYFDEDGAEAVPIGVLKDRAFFSGERYEPFDYSELLAEETGVEQFVETA